MERRIIANEDVAVGAYIEYTPIIQEYIVEPEDSGYEKRQIFNPSEITLWKAFYNRRGTLDIISAESVGNLILCGEKGYKNAVKILHDMSKAYVNPQFAVGARGLGETKESVYSLNNILKCGVRGYPYEDQSYMEDVNQLRKNALLNDRECVWLASRAVNSYSSNSYSSNSYSSNSFFYVRLMVSGGSVYDDDLYYVDSVGSTYSYSRSFGVLNVVSLDFGIQIIGGAGTSRDPYKISR